MLPIGGVGAEIGVWGGDFSCELLRHVRPRELHLIDPWQRATGPEYAAAWYAREQAQLDSLYSEVQRRFSDDRRVTIHRLSSREAAAFFPDSLFDWVYVDGDHTHAAVRADLELYWPKLRSGGLLAGDDYGHPGWWEDGVTRAVNDFAAKTGWHLQLVGNDQWVLRG